jgi:hypothetical protein
VRESEVAVQLQPVGRPRDRGRAPAGPARGARATARLRQGVRELVLGWLHDDGTPLAPARALELLALDIELNAQGLEAWLDRQ